ncbi:MAG: LCP family protein [Clostridia bacterium]|nr:LCP family protein [Clostridia bacterium]
MSGRMIRLCLTICAIVLVLVIGALGAHMIESRMTEKVENAGQQITAHTHEETTAQVFMNNQWYQKKDVETLLVIGIDDYGVVTSSGSYNNSNQADFLMLFVKDTETGKSQAIHLNRDTMTDITMRSVTGEAVGVRRAQLALSYNYGQGQHDSSKNTADAVSNLLYGVQIDHYITVTMDAIPIMNDWAGGVTVEVMTDMTDVDSALIAGNKVKLTGEQALKYIRTRMGLDDSTNTTRMERQRQYAAEWVTAAQKQLKDESAVADLVVQMSDYYYSDCTADELEYFAEQLGNNSGMPIRKISGEAVRGEVHMEFYADDTNIQRLVLEMFYEPAN